MAEQTVAPVRLLAGVGAETTARNRAIRVEHALARHLGRAPTLDERFAALVPTLFDILSDRPVGEVDAAFRKAHAELSLGFSAGRVLAARIAEVRHG